MDLSSTAPDLPPERRARMRAHAGALRARAHRLFNLMLAALVAALAAAASTALAQPAATLDAAVRDEIRAFGASIRTDVEDGPLGDAARVEVEAGELDPRLRLAPCEQVQAQLPLGARAWGRTRIALRCVRGPVAWQVYLPVTVRVHAPAWVAALPLPAGTVLQPQHLRLDEVDWAAERQVPVADAERAIGQRLRRALAPGQALRSGDLIPVPAFNAGERVQLFSRGPGFVVSAEAQALAPGYEGQSVRVRTDSGRVVTGTVVGTRRVEALL